MANKGETSTLLEVVQVSLAHAGRYNPGDLVAPGAVLWTDADGQWRPVVQRLRALMPELLTLGDYDTSTRTGPAIWLRCVIEPAVRADKFPDLAWPAEVVPVIYMPGVSRQMLRGGEECPDALKSLVELQYRGTVWAQKNGRDWTVRALLVSDDGGLALDVAEDRLTAQAMLGALSQLAIAPVTPLRGKRLEAEDFDRLMIGDTPRDLLLWLGDPAGTREQWDASKWSAFCSRCREEYGFDPETDGELAGGEKLGCQKGTWLGPWQRFAEAPGIYSGIPALLRRAKPATLVFNPDAWPDEAESREVALRGELGELASESQSAAHTRILGLEKDHGERRAWVWARLGMCPLAQALEHLAALAEATSTAHGGESTEEMGAQYRERGYRADGAALRALASVKRDEDRKAIGGAIRSLYLPWLEDGAGAFQKKLLAEDIDLFKRNKPVAVESGDCLLFVDGLRYDLGERLAAAAEERGLEVERSWRWSALPTVTATAKPAVAPLGDGILSASSLVADFAPQYGDDRKPLTTDRLRRAIRERKVELVDETVAGMPLRAEATGWAECGSFDKLGHDLGTRLADQIDDELMQVLDRITGLLDAGWRRVRVVTDHGWLLMPGGLEALTLPEYLTDSRWARCAAIKDTSHVEVPVFGWTWNRSERFATAPGARAFKRNVEYAHGGVSLQECVTPDLTMNSPTTSGADVVRIVELSWTGLRCRITSDPATPGGIADLRTKPNDPQASVSLPKAVDSEGKVSLLVADADLRGTAVRAVIVDRVGHVVASAPTTIGGEG